jgi:ATP-citrate lyase beta-subunit
MSRKKVSEFRAKQLLSSALDLICNAWEIDTSKPIKDQLEAVKPMPDGYVLKVDQGIKGRYKKGLVVLGLNRTDLEQAVNKLQNKGFQWLLIEPMVPHESTDEQYISFSRQRNGILLSHSKTGGIDVEANPGKLKTLIINKANLDEAAKLTGIETKQIKELVKIMNEEHTTLLEINPYAIVDRNLHILDIAMEVDDAGGFFSNGWSPSDFREYHGSKILPQEKTVLDLAKKSPASFKLNVLNPNGAIFLLLSGGGASIAIADEVYNRGFGPQLANYGEYSGNPNTDETQLYAAALLELLISSNAKKKILFIGGAVANFTDIANTFTGIIKALERAAKQLKHQSLKVFVRRGGPRQEIGLAMMEDALQKYGILGAVNDGKISLSEAVGEALEYLNE